MNAPISQRAMGSIPEQDQPISERYRLIGEDWADAEAAAKLREELKTSTLSKMKQNLIMEEGPMPDNQAERIVKCSKDWVDYITAMCTDRAKADRLWMRMKSLDLAHWERQNQDANRRKEMGLSR